MPKNSYVHVIDAKKLKGHINKLQTLFDLDFNRPRVKRHFWRQMKKTEH